MLLLLLFVFNRTLSLSTKSLYPLLEQLNFAHLFLCDVFSRLIVTFEVVLQLYD